MRCIWIYFKLQVDDYAPIKYPSAYFVHSADILIFFPVGIRVSRVGFGVAALPVLGVFVCARIGFRRSRFLTDKFLVFIGCLSGIRLVEIGFGVHYQFLVWVVGLVWVSLQALTLHASEN